MIWEDWFHGRLLIFGIFWSRFSLSKRFVCLFFWFFILMRNTNKMILLRVAMYAQRDQPAWPDDSDFLRLSIALVISRFLPLAQSLNSGEQNSRSVEATKQCVGVSSIYDYLECGCASGHSNPWIEKHSALYCWWELIISTTAARVNRMHLMIA